MPRDVALLRAAAVLALLLLSACGTMAKWHQSQQAQQAASAHRQQTEEAAAINSESKQDRAAKLQRAQHDERLRRLQAELAARADADSLAASAVFARELAGPVADTSLTLAASAVATAPVRADLALLELQLCASTPDCDTAPLEARLAQLDPDNGMSFIYALIRADQANLNAPWRAARERLAQAPRITLYWNPIVSHLTAAVSGRQGFDTVAAMAELIGVEAALPAPLQAVSRACSVQDVQDPEVLAQCRRIAAAFMKADTVLFEAYGTTLAIRLWPEGSTESQQITVERRGLRYRMEQMRRFAAKFNSPAATRALAGYVQRYPTEQTALGALFADLGMPTEPPANWVDNTPGG
jgi:hypothetical protein